MAYYPNFQPYPYQDQLNQLRSGQPAATNWQRPDQQMINWVQGEAGAKSWFVAPGATVLLMDSEDMRFYLKTADQSGMPSMRVFQYTEVGAPKPQEATQTDNFVTVETFGRFKDEVLARLDELSAPVEVSLSRKKKGVNADE